MHFSNLKFGADFGWSNLLFQKALTKKTSVTLVGFSEKQNSSRRNISIMYDSLKINSSVIQKGNTALMIRQFHSPISERFRALFAIQAPIKEFQKLSFKHLFRFCGSSLKVA